MTTVFPVERQEVVVGERKHKECCVVGEGEQQGRHGGTVDCRRVLGEKGRSWMMRMTCYDTRRAAQKHKCLHHVIFWERRREAAQEPIDSHHTTQSFLEVPPLFVLLEYGLGVL